MAASRDITDSSSLTESLWNLLFTEEDATVLCGGIMQKHLVDRVPKTETETETEKRKCAICIKSKPHNILNSY